MIRNVHFDEIPYLMQEMAEQGVDIANTWKVRMSAVVSYVCDANALCMHNASVVRLSGPFPPLRSLRYSSAPTTSAWGPATTSNASTPRSLGNIYVKSSQPSAITCLASSSTWRVLSVPASIHAFACQHECRPPFVHQTLVNRSFSIITQHQVELFNVSAIYRLTENVPYCQLIHQLVFVECLCAFGLEAGVREWRERMDDLTVIYNAKIREVVGEFMQERNDVRAMYLIWDQGCRVAGLLGWV